MLVRFVISISNRQEFFCKSMEIEKSAAFVAFKVVFISELVNCRLMIRNLKNLKIFFKYYKKSFNKRN